MLREIQTVNGKNADATYVADVALVRGMGVQKNNGEAVLPAATTCENIFLATKESIPTGLLSVQGEISDYNTAYENIAIGEGVVLIAPVAGEKYATDQTTGELAAGDYLGVATSGKFIKVTIGVSKFVCRGTYTDGTRTLTKIEVIDAHTVA